MSTGKTDVERIKAASRGLRGTLVESLDNPLTGALAEDDTQLSKFHGIYQQDDRDVRSERTRRRLEPAYAFMIRARVPAGICTPAQWLAMDELARKYANGSIRLTTRQAFQLHGVIRNRLRPVLGQINSAMLDTLAACGDVNRNVMAPVFGERSSIHADVAADARMVSDHLTPRTRAYHEIWLDGEKLADADAPDAEPVYGPTYLPRKFKTGFAVPPQNDIDVFSQDLGFVAIVENGGLSGYNVLAGGGMGTTHGDSATYPRLADVIGFCRRDDVRAVAEAVVTVQRDFGDRAERRHARLKYTIDDRGLDWFREQVVERAGVALEAPRRFAFTHNGDAYGWQRDDNGEWHYLLFVENGRIADIEGRPLMSALRAIAAVHDGEFRLTPNQNLAICRISDTDRQRIGRLLADHGVDNASSVSPLRLHSMACVALPTCGLAMAESERYLPSLVDRLEQRVAAAGLGELPITIRMTGCPNGCARPYIAEIGLVGKAPGRYNLYLGAGFAGQRLGRLYRDNANEEEIVAALDPLFERYAAERDAGERFGDFLIRSGIVAAVSAGADVHRGGSRA